MEIRELYEKVEATFVEYDTAVDGKDQRSIVRKLAGKGKQLIKNQKGKKLIADMMPSEDDRARQRREIWKGNPMISVVVPLYNTPEVYLREMIESVMDQTYENWELCLGDGSDENGSYVETVCREYEEKDARVRYQRLEENRGIAENTNACICMSNGTHIALFDHDDILHPCALYECMKKMSVDKSQFVYTDEATFMGDKVNQLVTIHTKQNFAFDTLRSVNYVCHLSVFEKALLEKTGMFDPQFDGSQDHAMILKLTAVADRVSHVAKILYFWRIHDGSVSKDITNKEYAITAGKQAVRLEEEQRGYPAEVYSSKICATQYRLEYKILDDPKVLVVICGDRQEGLEHAREQIAQHTDYTNYEILTTQSEFRHIKKALESRDGEYVVFLTDKMEPLHSQWLTQLLMYAQQDGVLAVGGKIVDENGVIVQAGGRMEKGEQIRDPYKGISMDEIGHMGELFYAHNVDALEGIGMMCRKESIFHNHFRESFKDLMQEQVYLQPGPSVKERSRMVMNPYAVLMRHS